MSDKRRGLGRGLGALIPSGPAVPGAPRPSDVFFAERPASTPVVDTDDKDAAAASGEPGAGATDLESASDGFTGNRDVRSDGAVSENTAPDNTSSATNKPSEASQDDAGRHDDVPAPVGNDAELAPVPGATFAEVPVGQIRPNPKQPRQVFDEDDLAELVTSVREIGVLQPIVVRPLDEVDGEIRYELIMGERRWRASKESGNETVPAIIRSTADEDLLRDALLENLHRAQLNPLEEAAAYQQLLEDFGCTHDQLAGRIGRSRPQISNTIRLLKLPPLVQRRVAAGVLSAGHARALLGLPDAAAMERLAQRIVAEGLSVRTVEEIVTLGGDAAPARRSPRAGTRHPQLDDLAASLSDQLDTRVAVSLGKRKGKLTVEFASVDDLHRIMGVLGLEENGRVTENR